MHYIYGYKSTQKFSEKTNKLLPTVVLYLAEF